MLPFSRRASAVSNRNHCPADTHTHSPHHQEQESRGCRVETNSSMSQSAVVVVAHRLHKQAARRRQDGANQITASSHQFPLATGSLEITIGRTADQRTSPLTTSWPASSCGIPLEVASCVRLHPDTLKLWRGRTAAQD